jgi:hypothetical protein
MIHWLVFKRSDYLISRGSRGAIEHAKILVLFFILISADLLISFFFNKKFDLESETMNEIYVIVGFEFMRLFLKACEDNMKYTLSLVELYNNEQWTEKVFTFNVLGFFFDVIVLGLNIRLFVYIVSRQ